MNVRINKDDKIKVKGSNDVYPIMQKILLRQNKIRRSQEYFWVAGLDNSNNILFVELISIGASNRVHVSPPNVFRMGIYKLAVKMILVHNHPSGNLKVSDTDKILTNKLLKAGKLIEIDIVDHLIITEKKYFSFADAGLIKDFEINSLLELVDKEKDEIKALKVEVEKEKAKKQNSLEIARKMKSENFKIEIIKKLTRLTKNEIDEIK